MNEEIAESEDYEIWGLSPCEVRDLLAALDRVGIKAQTRFIEEPVSNDLEGDSPDTEIVVTVDAAAVDEVQGILNDLFKQEDESTEV